MRLNSGLAHGEFEREATFVKKGLILEPRFGKIHRNKFGTLSFKSVVEPLEEWSWKFIFLPHRVIKRVGFVDLRLLNSVHFNFVILIRVVPKEIDFEEKEVAEIYGDEEE